MKKTIKLLSFAICIVLVLSPISINVAAEDRSSEKNLYEDDFTNNFSCFESNMCPIQVASCNDVSRNDMILSDLSSINGCNILPIGEMDEEYSRSVNITSSCGEILAKILSKDPFSIEGTICVNGINKNLNTYYDFSMLSRFEIAEWIYGLGFITELQKIECFCDLILNKNFENINCLNEVANAILLYSQTHRTNEELLTKINAVLDPMNRNGVNRTSNLSYELENELTVSNGAFTVHYDSEKNDLQEAQAVLSYLNQIKTTFDEYNFLPHLNTSGQSKLSVYLDPDANAERDSLLGQTCFSVPNDGSASKAYIVMYKFTELNTEAKESIAHEYFHTIQGAYKVDDNWFIEASANACSIIVNNSSNTFTSQINEAISSPYGLTAGNKYGQCMFVLAIYQKFGGMGSIREIFEEYANCMSPNLSTEELIDVINDGIENQGYIDGFKLAYRDMASYMLNPCLWYPKLSNNNDILPKDPGNRNLSSSTLLTFSGYVGSLNSKHFKLDIDENSDFIGQINIEVTFDGGDGYIQVYYDNYDSEDTIAYPNTINGSAVFIDNGLDVNETNANLIISNLSHSDTLSYQVKVTLMPKIENITAFDSDSQRYFERLLYLNAGSEAEIGVTFNVPGTKVVQTFGNKDTVVELYSSNGTLIASNDDGGYATNGMLQFNAVANQKYVIKVRYYSSTNSGVTKLAVLPANGEFQTGSSSFNRYESIKTYTEAEIAINSSITANHGKCFVFCGTVEESLRFNIESEFDAFIYVIDPRSTEFLIENKDYNDDAYTNPDPYLQKILDANVPYLIICTTSDITDVPYNTGNFELGIYWT